jgi:5-methylcytosine-specific restriction endonuclease McrA
MEMAKLICSGCGNVFQRNSNQVFYNRSFCTNDCYRTFSSKKSKQVVKNYNIIRNKILDRDGCKCVICGTREEILDIHHKDKSGDSSYWEFSNNNLDNLITVCKSCHTKSFHSQGIYIENDTV